MTSINELKFENRDALVTHLKEDIINALASGISSRGKASMLLSGGTTPGTLYQAMSKSELDWEKVWFAPTDERWVAPDHVDSNEKLIRDTLIQNNASAAHYIGLKSMSNNPRDGQKEAEQIINQLPRPFDVVLLGMGDDGHTASLIPNLKGTQYALDENCCDLCAPIITENGSVDRMTMTLNCLLNTKNVILYFYGKKKLAVFEQAKNKKSPTFPVSHLLHQNKVPVTLYWAE